MVCPTLQPVKKWIAPLLVLVVIAAVMCGCTQNSSPGSSPAAQPTAAITTPAPAVPQVTTPEIAPPTAPESLNAQDTENESDEDTAGPATPAVGLPATITGLSGSAGGPVDNCVMTHTLPDILTDPDYGLNSAATSELAGFSPGQYATIRREYSETSSTIDYCGEGAVKTPIWTWYTISATITPNGHTLQTYNITLYADYLSTRIPVVSTTGTLSPGLDYPYRAYVPMRLDDLEKNVHFELDALPQTS